MNLNEETNQIYPYVCQLCNKKDSVQKIKCTNYLWDIWNQQSLKIKGTNLTLTGFSVAALRTNFYLKELNIMFDGGLSSNYEPSHIFITHLHTDHISNCPWHFDPCEKKNVKFYVPQHSKLRFYNFLEASHPFKGKNDLINQESEIIDAYSITEVEDKHNINLEIKGKKITIEIIRCYHSVRCTSYGLIENKQKLKKEYIGLNGNQIKELKFSGVEITETILDPFFLYVGDTSKEILLDDRLKKYSTIMIECTFLNVEELSRADETMHMHWNYLKDYIQENKSITFILYHFSSRYKREYINDFFSKVNMSNIIIWNSN